MRKKLRWRSRRIKRMRQRRRKAKEMKMRRRKKKMVWEVNMGTGKKEEDGG